MATKYVARSGSDLSAGSIGAPWKTLAFAVAHIAAGDEILMRGVEYDGFGVWDEVLWYNIPSGGSVAAYTRLAAYPNETATIKPSAGTGTKVLYFAGDGPGGNSGAQKWIEIDGLKLDASLIMSDTVKIESNAGAGYNAHHIRLKNCDIIGGQNLHDGGLNGNMCILIASLNASDIGANEVLNCQLHGAGGSNTFGYGVYCQACDNILDGNNIYDLNGAGIQIYNGQINDAGASRNIVRNNVFHDIIRSSDTRIEVIVIGRGADNQIYNTLIYNNGGGFADTYGIYLFHGATSTIVQNTLYNNGRWGMVVEPAGLTATIRNNIAYSHTTNYQDNGGSSITHSNNIDTGTNPLFVNVGAGNFRLAAGSPAIDFGAALGITPDIAGTSRPQGSAPDAGAYESTGTVVSPHTLSLMGAG